MTPPGPVLVIEDTTARTVLEVRRGECGVVSLAVVSRVGTIEVALSAEDAALLRVAVAPTGTVLAVDPPGCGCTECMTGLYVPLDQATEDQVQAARMGIIGDNTGGWLTEPTASTWTTREGWSLADLSTE